MRPQMVWPGFDGGSGPSDDTRRLIDDEVRRIIDDCYDTAAALLHDNRDKLDRLAHTLLEKESLDEEEAYAAAGVERSAAPSPAAGAAPATIQS